jgi:[protein-PII] uridylyltransferase
MASFALDQTHPAAEAAVKSADLIDAGAHAAQHDALAAARNGSEAELRTAVAQRLKAVLQDGRALAEQMLLDDRHGRGCAERICRMEDEIIRLLSEFTRKHLYPAQNLS